MKVEERVLDHFSNMTGEKIALKVHVDAMAHIMSVLTNLYSDPEMAVIREYSTNAFDAHVEAGISRPIEVQLPTSLAPYFKVRDFGAGLNAEDIREIYSQYGASTKRDSNEVVGMLGLGCKSALTYTSQFTLIGVKNGIATQVSISYDESGSGSMQIVDQRKSDDHSGVTVIVPTKGGNNFAGKAKKFFSVWTPGTVLVNGEAPARVEGLWIADDIVLITNGAIDKSYIVMGNVAYPALPGYDLSYQPNYRNNVHSICFVDIGSVNFTPSRESLMATKTTKDTLINLRVRIKKEKNVAFQKLIDEAKNKNEALDNYYKVKDLGFDGKPEYKGAIMPTEWRYPDSNPAVKGNRFLSTPTPSTPYDSSNKFLVISAGSHVSRRRFWSIEHALAIRPTDRYSATPTGKKYVWVTGYTFSSDQNSITPYKREKLVQFMAKQGYKDNNLPGNYVFVKDLPPHSDWIEPSLVYKWEDIEKEKIVREKVERRDGRPSGSYSGYVGKKNERVILAKDIDITKPLFWYQGTSGYYMELPGHTNWIFDLHPDATVISLHGNRIKKFKRDFPEAKVLGDYVREFAKNWADALTDDQKRQIHFMENPSDMLSLKNLDETSLDDPELVKTITEIKNIGKNTTLTTEWNRYKKWVVMKNYKWTSPLDKYPLLTSIYSFGTLRGAIKDHLYLYLNCAYKQMAATAAESEV